MYRVAPKTAHLQILTFIFPRVVWQHKFSEAVNESMLLKLCTSGTLLPKLFKSDSINESYAQMKKGYEFAIVRFWATLCCMCRSR